MQNVIREVGTVPLRSLGYSVGASVLSASIDFAYWTGNRPTGPVGYIAGGLAFCAAMVAIYSVSMAMIPMRGSILSCLRFAPVMVALQSAPLLGIGLLVLAPGDMDRTALIIPVLLLLFSGIIISALLAGWPIAQAVAARPVSPFAAYRASAGHRWGLIVASFCMPALGKIVPNISTARTNIEAIAIAVGNGVVSCAIIIFTAAIAVTAWKLARDHDVMLDADPVQS
jgi:hypothetical protein